MIKLEKPNQRLKAIRIARNYNEAKDFCEDHKDIKYTTYLKHESGTIPLSKKAAKLYAQYLDISEDYLLNGQEIEMPKNYSKSIRKKALEPIIISKLLQAVFMLIDNEIDKKILSQSCFQKNIDYDALIKNIFISSNEIIDRVDNLDEIDIVVNTIATLNRESFFRCILK